MKESHKRTVAKTVTFRIVAILATFLLSFIYLENISESLGITIIMNLTGIFIYYVHERAWNRTLWGKH